MQVPSTEYQIYLISFIWSQRLLLFLNERYLFLQKWHHQPKHNKSDCRLSALLFAETTSKLCNTLPIMYYLLYIACWLPMDCPWCTYYSHNGYGPGPGPKAEGPGPKEPGPPGPVPQLLGSLSLVPGPYPSWLNICHQGQSSGNHQAINMQ